MNSVIDRKQNTRRKIELGGLIIKAKLDELNKAQILVVAKEKTQAALLRSILILGSSLGILLLEKSQTNNYYL